MKVLFALVAVLVLSVFTSDTDTFATHVSKPNITMDKTAYKAGETVIVKGWVEYNASPTSNVLLDIIIRTPAGNEMVRESVRSDTDGNFVFNFELPADALSGNYTVEVISQCRDEHRDICTNQRSSIQLTVTEGGAKEPSAEPIESSAEAMILPTDNGSINVEVTMDRETLEPEQPVGFTLKFVDPASGMPIQHVNYAFSITDENQNDVVSRADIHTHEGVDMQSVTFANTGSFTLVIDVTGIGINKPYDTKYSGTADTTLTVVPEFPLSILAVMAVIIGASIVIMRFRNLTSNRMQMP